MLSGAGPLAATMPAPCGSAQGARGGLVCEEEEFGPRGSRKGLKTRNPGTEVETGTKGFGHGSCNVSGLRGQSMDRLGMGIHV